MDFHAPLRCNNKSGFYYKLAIILHIIIQNNVSKLDLPS